MRKQNCDIPELLAPAGSLTGLKAVIAAGADAVYIGGSRFGARAYAENPEENDLLQGIDYAHERNVKVYLTVNTLLKQAELYELYDFMLPFYRAGVDAVLVQDFGVLTFLHRHFPDLPLHASTQMTITGPESASLLRKYGVTRIVPARELSIGELKEMKEKSGLEIETFIHGALCCCYSGLCLYSSMLGGRSGNRGRCAQPCRLLYLLDNRDFDGTESIVDRKDARHYLSPKDLCGIDLLEELTAQGISSLKIEGRMKKPEYAAGVVSVYRRNLDRIAAGETGFTVSEEDHRMLYDLYNRSGFNDGYYHHRNGPSMMALIKHELTPKETEARHKLYEEMHRLYIEREKKIPLDIEGYVYQDSPIQADFSAAGKSVTVTGDTALAAVNSALTEKRIAGQLQKTGDTGFSVNRITVFTDDASFVPVKSLNELRRLGTEKLRNEILADYRRSGEVPPETSENLTVEKGDGQKKEFTWSALVSSEQQLREVLKSKLINTVIVESHLLYDEPDPVKAAENICRRVIREGKSFMPAFPHVDREGSRAEELKEAADRLIGTGAVGFLVRSLETAAVLSADGLGEYVTADHTLYTYNREACEFLESIGLKYNTAPVELNKKELFKRDNRMSELIVYGRLPLMVTVQCLAKNTHGCRHECDSFTLTDRMGIRFPVKCMCNFCYNIIRNSLPLMLLQELPAISRMNFRSLRMEFTDEDARETSRILSMAEAAAGGTLPESDGTWTRGHFLRGVE